MKRLLLLAGIALMLPFTAHAQKSRYSTAQLCQILQLCLPPAQYASSPYMAKPKRRQVSLKQIQGICGGGYARFLGNMPQGPETVQAVVDAGGNFGTLGCAQLNAGVLRRPSAERPAGRAAGALSPGADTRARALPRLGAPELLSRCQRRSRHQRRAHDL